MKNYIYTIGLLLAILLLAGCTDTDLQETQQAGSDADKVYLRIGLTMPEAQMVQSRSFDRVDDTPNHQNFAFNDLHVAVFVKQGDSYILEEFVSAEGDNLPEWDGDASDSNCPGSNHWDFGVNLTKREEGNRRLHFIANYPGLTMGFGEESTLIGRLLTNETLDAKGEHDIYWNYMDVTSIQDGTQELLRNIPMLRNFAKVEIELTPKQDVNLNGKFKLIGYAIHNKPKKGTAAPYNSANGEFANYVVKNGTSMSCQTYENLEKTQGYVGNEPYDNEYQKLTDFNAVTYNSDGTITAAPFYLYERTHVGADDPTCIILKGKYAADGNFEDAQVTYYKLDFVHRDAQTSTNVYYNLLRNFIYTMNIVDVSGAGYNTVDDAIRNPASNNIAGNTDIEKFTNISDGDARLFVSTTYVVFTDEEPIDIYYQYIPDLKNKPTVHNNNSKGISGGEIVVSTPTKEVLESRDVADSDETTGHVGWRKITLTPKAGFNGRKVEYLTIASSTLQRKITIVRRNPYPMDVYAYDPNDQDKLVAKTAKSEVDVKVSIEGGIPEALFPLKFYVTSDENSIYAKPGGDMYSESYNGGYGFVKEITWDFYRNANETGKDASNQPVGIKESDGKISFICNFLTNCAQSATDVYVYNEYFNRGTDSFENLNMSISFSDETRRYGSGQTFTMTFETDKAGVYSLSGNVDFVSVSGTGASLNADTKKLTLNSSGTCTITCRTTTWADAANVTITLDSDDRYSVSATGDERNVLFIKPQNITGTSIQNNSEIRMRSGSKITSANLWNNATQLGNKSNLINDGYAYKVDDLNEYEVFYLGYRISSGGGGYPGGGYPGGGTSYTYYNSQLTAGELAGTDLQVTCTAN